MSLAVPVDAKQNADHEDEQRSLEVDVRYAPASNPRMEWKAENEKVWEMGGAT